MADMDKKLTENELSKVAGGSKVSELVDEYKKQAINNGKNVVTQDSYEGPSGGSPTFNDNANKGNIIIYGNGTNSFNNNNNGNLAGNQNIIINRKNS